MLPKARLDWRTCDRRPPLWQGLHATALVPAIELETEWLAESRQRPLAAVGFRCLERNVMHITWRETTPLTRPMAFANDGCFPGMDGDAHLGDIDGEK